MPPAGPSVAAPGSPPAQPAQGRFDALRESIRTGRGGIEEARQALAEPDAQGLVNTVLALYFLRADPRAMELAGALWRGNRAAAPGAAWDLLARPAARIAIAHTLARLAPQRAGELLPFIRAGLADPDPFAQAQAAVALAFVGDDSDVPAVEALARGGERYASEAAIKALALQGGDAAYAALMRLRPAFSGDAGRSTVLRRVMAERWPEREPGATP